MTAKQEAKIEKQLEYIDKCVKEGPAWDEAGWAALIDDIDLQIEKLQSRIAELRKVRKIAQRNLQQLKAFPWERSDESLYLKKPLVIS